MRVSEPEHAHSSRVFCGVSQLVCWSSTALRASLKAPRQPARLSHCFWAEFGDCSAGNRSSKSLLPPWIPSRASSSSSRPWPFSCHWTQNQPVRRKHVQNHVEGVIFTFQASKCLQSGCFCETSQWNPVVLNWLWRGGADLSVTFCLSYPSYLFQPARDLLTSSCEDTTQQDRLKLHHWPIKMEKPWCCVCNRGLFGEYTTWQVYYKQTANSSSSRPCGHG